MSDTEYFLRWLALLCYTEFTIFLRSVAVYLFALRHPGRGLAEYTLFVRRYFRRDYVRLRACWIAFAALRRKAGVSVYSQ